MVSVYLILYCLLTFQTAYLIEMRLTEFLCCGPGGDWTHDLHIMSVLLYTTELQARYKFYFAFII